MPVTSRSLTFLIWPAFLFLVVRYHMEMMQGGQAFITAEWLINMEAEWIRRGLIGTLLIWLSDLGLPLKWLVFSVQVLFLFAFFAFAQALYLLRERDPAWLMLFLSPAFLLFAFYDLGGAFRKELIGFVAFQMLTLAYVSGRRPLVWIGGGLLLFLLGAFSHELTAMMLPFFLYLVFRMYREGLLALRLALPVAAAFMGVALAGLLFAYAFPGDLESPGKVCLSVVERGMEPSICTGAFSWLGMDPAQGVAYVRDFLPKHPHYVYWFLLALVPVLMSDWARRNSRLLLLGILCILPLFFLGIDWGRWVHVYIVLVSLTMLAESARRPVLLMRAPAWLMAFYLVSWNIPHCCADPISGGLLVILSKQLQGLY